MENGGGLCADAQVEGCRGREDTGPDNFQQGFITDRKYHSWGASSGGAPQSCAWPPAPGSALAWVRAGPRAWRLASGGPQVLNGPELRTPPALAWPPPHPGAHSPTKFRTFLPGTQQGGPASPTSLSRGTFPLPIVLPRLTDKGLIPGHKLKSRRLCAPKMPVMAWALPSEYIQSSGVTRSSVGNRQRATGNSEEGPGYQRELPGGGGI